MHPNEKLLREADEAMARGDNEAYIAFHTDDVIVHIAGNNQLSGTYKGKAEFLKVFQKFMGLSPEFTFEGHDYLASDEHGVVIQRSHYARGDTHLDSNDTFISHFRDGKVAEFWFVPEDQAAVDAFFK